MVLILDAINKRVLQQLELALFQAWHTARLSHYSGQRLPKLKDELDKFTSLSRPKRQQSRDEIIAAMREIKARSVH